MKHIKDIYALVQQVRQRIIDTMIERGITKVEFIPTREAYDKEHENDEDYSDLDWDELKSNTTPAVVCNSIKGENQQYDVLSIELVDVETKSARFKLECSGDYADDTFYDSELFYFSMLGVYQELEEYLGIDNEPETLWLVRRESNDDGEKHFYTKVCRDRETANRILKEWRDKILAEHPKFKDAKPYVDGEKDADDQDCCYEWEECSRGFMINMLYDDYYEDIVIEPQEII